jgi:hypothetical protein
MAQKNNTAKLTKFRSVICANAIRKTIIGRIRPEIYALKNKKGRSRKAAAF